MRVIDFHNHLLNEPNYIDNLVREMDRLGIERVAISGLGSLFMMQDDEAVLKAMHRYPGRFIGFVFIRPGYDTNEKIIHYHDLGFSGVKVTCPVMPYDAKEYYDLWETASDLKMPVFFHTGIVTAVGAKPTDDISSVRMHPYLLEPIARTFPNLNLIMAHCGVSFTMDASDVIRMLPNVYCDITGTPNGWRNRLTLERFRDFFWWDGAYEKIVFGTDVHWRDMGSILDADRNLYTVLQVHEEIQTKIFAGTAECLIRK